MRILIILLVIYCACFGLEPPPAVEERSCVQTPIWYVDQNPNVFIVIDCYGVAWWMHVVSGKIIKEYSLFNGKTLDNTVNTLRATLASTPFKEEPYGSN